MLWYVVTALVAGKSNGVLFSGTWFILHFVKEDNCIITCTVWSECFGSLLVKNESWSFKPI